MDSRIPDAVHASGKPHHQQVKIDILKGELMAENTLNKKCAKKIAEIEKQLVVERAAHAETKTALELALQAEQRALQGWHEQQKGNKDASDLKSDRLPTREELYGKLLTVSKFLNELEGSKFRKWKIWDREVDNYFTLAVVSRSGDNNNNPETVWHSKNIEYAPELKPPGEFEPVFIRFEDSTYVRNSKGFFHKTGGLVIFDTTSIRNNDDVFNDRWCSVHDRSHHSTNWNPKWEHDLGVK